MSTLSAQTKKAITHDWSAAFPMFGVYRPMWIARVVGPFVQGICLDRSTGNDAYFPTTHLHNLCRGNGRVTLSLGQRLRSVRSGVQERVNVKFHAEKFREVSDALSKQSLLSLRDTFTADDVLKAYEEFRLKSEPDSQYPIHLFEDAIMLLAWQQRIDEARAYLSRVTSEIENWPAFVLAKFGGVELWKAHISEKVANVDTLHSVVLREIEQLKLGKLPHYSLKS